MITTVTLNPAIDKAYRVDGQICPGTVFRVLSCRNTAGGKGLNVARAAALCDEPVTVTGLAGGYNGAYLEELLKLEGIPSRFVPIKGETRCCINVLDERNVSTELLEPGPFVGEREVGRFLEEFQNVIQESRVIVLSGSVPAGVRKNIYADLAEMAGEMGKTVILDTSGELLKEGMKGRPFMIKPNLEELETLLGRRITTLSQLEEAARCLEDQGIRQVVVSLGKEGALLVCGEGVYLGKPPDVAAVNTVGCGDSMVAAFAAACERSYSPRESLGYAVAVSAASAASEGTGSFCPKLVKQFSREITVNRL